MGAPAAVGAEPPAPQIFPENESTDPHRNPDTATEQGNLTAVKRQLVDRAGGMLVACARRGTIETPTNGTCQPLTDNETYPLVVSQYEIVAADTPGPGDDDLPAVMSRAGDRQVAFVRAVVTYRSTLAAYREATDQNRTRRALVLARRVSVLAARIEALGGQLTGDYDVIARQGPASLGPARRVVSNTTRNATQTARQLRSAEFTTPTLSLAVNRTNVSFARPARLTGQLRTNQGDPLADRVVAVETPAGETRTRTDENGTFTARYRPTTAPAGNVTVVARYRPRDDSIRLETSTERTVSVQPTTGTVRLTNVTSSVRFGEALRVRGTVRANGTPVAGLPLSVALEDREFATVRTNETGRFNATLLVPPDTPPRNRTLTVGGAETERALAADSASTTVRVERTTPRLVVGAERTDAETVRVFGRLAAGDAGVPGARLQFRHRGESAGVVRLNETGALDTNVTLDGVAPDEPTVLVVVYAPAGGNLEPLELQVQVDPVPRGPPDVSGVRETASRLLTLFLRVDPTLLAFGAFAALLVFLVATSAASRARGAWLGSLWPFGADDEGDDPDETADDEVDDAQQLSLLQRARSQTALDAARARLEDGRPDEAVILAHDAARAHLDGQIAGVDPSLTHWELLVVARDALDGERRAALERLTERYENAAFSSGQNTVETARAALDSAVVVTGDDGVGEQS